MQTVQSEICGTFSYKVKTKGNLISLVVCLVPTRLTLCSQVPRLVQVLRGPGAGTLQLNPDKVLGASSHRSSKKMARNVSFGANTE